MALPEIISGYFILYTHILSMACVMMDQFMQTLEIASGELLGLNSV
jgi:hypothetical protein